MLLSTMMSLGHVWSVQALEAYALLLVMLRAALSMAACSTEALGHVHHGSFLYSLIMIVYVGA